MEKDKIIKAAQLADDLKKVNRALEVFDQSTTGQVAVRVSSRVTDGEMMFAYLPKCIAPAICQVLAEAKNYIIKEMEEL
ncbi:MAG: hypothetical protein IJ307_05760 [Bacteroidales bacterium]|nr:hypothetical protein [Bacteroidales bacterium]